MNVAEFPTATALAKYVTDQAIAQAKIVQIWWKDGQWYLFWYT